MIMAGIGPITTHDLKNSSPEKKAAKKARVKKLERIAELAEQFLDVNNMANEAPELARLIEEVKQNAIED